MEGAEFFIYTAKPRDNAALQLLALLSLSGLYM